LPVEKEKIIELLATDPADSQAIETIDYGIHQNYKEVIKRCIVYPCLVKKNIVASRYEGELANLFGPKSTV
jgi:hypothetical protein